MWSDRLAPRVLGQDGDDLPDGRLDVLAPPLDQDRAEFDQTLARLHEQVRGARCHGAVPAGGGQERFSDHPRASDDLCRVKTGDIKQVPTRLWPTSETGEVDLDYALVHRRTSARQVRLETPDRSVG